MKLLNYYADKFSITGTPKRHQSTKERARRIRQVLNGQLKMAGTDEILAAYRQQQLLEKGAA